MNLPLPFIRVVTVLSSVLVFAGCDSSDDDEQDFLPDDSQSTVTITEDNYEAFLSAAVQATNVTALESDAERVSNLANELLVGHNSNTLGEQGMTFVSETPFAEGVNHQYSCDAGGSLVLPVYEFSGITSQLGLNFDNCLTGLNHYDGDYYTRSTSFEFATTAFDNFVAAFDDGSAIALDGDYTSTTARAGVIIAQSWENTDYTQTNASGTKQRQSGLMRQLTVNVTRDMSGDSGYVSLADGTVGLVSPFENNAGIAAEFDLDTNSEELGQFSVSSSLAFDGDYYDWNTLNPDERSNFVVPTFPVSDLGSPLVLEGINGAASFSVESRPQIPEGSEQWNSGALTVTAADGSTVVLRPSAENPEMVEIQFNESGEIIQQVWSDLLQVKCPSALTGCQ